MYNIALYCIVLYNLENGLLNQSPSEEHLLQRNTRLTVEQRTICSLLTLLSIVSTEVGNVLIVLNVLLCLLYLLPSCQVDVLLLTFLVHDGAFPVLGVHSSCQVRHLCPCPRRNSQNTESKKQNKTLLQFTKLNILQRPFDNSRSVYRVLHPITDHRNERPQRNKHSLDCK